MDQETLAAMATDTKYREDKITKVLSSADRFEGWTIQVEDGGYLYIPRYQEVIVPTVGEIVRTYSRGPGHPVRGITVGGRVYAYMTEAQENALVGRTTESPVTPKPRDLLVELNTLRRACRALARVEPDADVFDEIKPDDMRRVLANRGWFIAGTLPWPGEPNRVAFEVYEHLAAEGTDRFGTSPSVKIPLDPTAGDWRPRVFEWVMAVALRHGDVSPAEILAEAL